MKETRNIFLGCIDVGAALGGEGCCSSCHWDDDDGYDSMVEYYPPHKNRYGDRDHIMLTVCCKAQKPETVGEWARVVNAYRNRMKE